jgi:hypothetical protein
VKQWGSEFELGQNLPGHSSFFKMMSRRRSMEEQVAVAIALDRTSVSGGRGSHKFPLRLMKRGESMTSTTVKIEESPRTARRSAVQKQGISASSAKFDDYISKKKKDSDSSLENTKGAMEIKKRHLSMATKEINESMSKLHSTKLSAEGILKEAQDHSRGLESTTGRKITLSGANINLPTLQLAGTNNYSSNNKPVGAVRKPVLSAGISAKRPKTP